MKKRIVIGTIILIVLCIGIIIWSNYKNIISKINQRHYDEIKENIQPDIEAYVRLTSYYCDPVNSENTAVMVITDETLIYQRGMDKELLLDIDRESYCKVRVEVRCVSKNKFDWDTYIKCKGYEDEN